MDTSAQSPAIKWPQIISLIALDIAIIISWIAYHKYQPGLLVQFNFVDFTLPLLILQGIILLVTPPIAGLIADRMIRNGGNRLPVITIGINFVSMVFMVVALTVFANPQGFIRLLFPVMIALWLISMNIFHSPAISTVEMFVPARKLPQVIALFAVVADLSSAIEPVIIDLIEFFGGPLTFAVGGALVFGTGFWFTRSTRNLVMNQEEADDSGYNVQTSNFPLVILLGILMGVGVMFFFELFPAWTELQLSFVGGDGISGNAFTSILIAVAAVLSYPLSLWLENKDIRTFALIGGLTIAALIGALYVLDGPLAVGVYFLYPVAFALISVTFLPIAFLSLERRHKVFGIGLFFGGLELASSVADVLQVM